MDMIKTLLPQRPRGWSEHYVCILWIINFLIVTVLLIAKNFLTFHTYIFSALKQQADFNHIIFSVLTMMGSLILLIKPKVFLPVVAVNVLAMLLAKFGVLIALFTTVWSALWGLYYIIKNIIIKFNDPLEQNINLYRHIFILLCAFTLLNGLINYDFGFSGFSEQTFFTIGVMVSHVITIGCAFFLARKILKMSHD